MLGSEHNDLFRIEKGKVVTQTNHCGGIQAGISNGEPIWFRSAFKPVSTLKKEQTTINSSGQTIDYKPRQGRHDPCVLPRAVPLVESMALLVLMDHYQRQRALKL